MSAQMDLLARLQARDPLEVIEELARYGKDKSGEAPGVTLYLSNGANVRGRIIDLAERTFQGSRVLAIQVIGDSGVPNDEVFYVRTDVIKAVTVHRAGSFINILSSGAIDAIPSGPPPTQLDFKRRISQFSKKLSEALGGDIGVTVDWPGIPGDSEAQWSFSNLLDEGFEAIDGILSDPMGKDEMKRRIGEISIIQGEEKSICLQDNVLIIKANLKKGKSGRFDRREIIEMIEKLL